MMAKFGVLVILVISSWFFACTAQAQHIIGSTQLDIMKTGTVIATCETDLDGEAQAYYEAVVSCIVDDGYGNQVASGEASDSFGNQGYAQAIVIFQGVPGTAYTAKGSHSAEMIIGDYRDSPSGGQPPSYPYLDYYNFGYYQEDPYQVHPYLFDWTGFVPEV